MSDIRIVGSIDIGNQSIKAVVARVSGDSVEVKGAGKAVARGIQDGRVENIEALAASIRTALDEAEMSAGTAVSRVVVSFSPRARRGVAVQVEQHLKRQNISRSDVAQLMRRARTLPPSSTDAVLHTEVHDFSVDDQAGITNPIDMVGSSLGLRGYNLLVPAHDLDCIRRAVTKCKVEVIRIVQEAHAAGYSVLDAQDRELGTLLVSIGADSTQVAIWSDGVLVRNATIPVGGRTMTNSIAVAGPFTGSVAEQLKTEFGVAAVSEASHSISVQVPSRGRGPVAVSTAFIATILEPHVQEILEVVGRELDLSGYMDRLRAGVVLTGGSASLPHITKVAERVLERNVRIGHPHGVSGIADLVRHPEYAACVGALEMLHQSDDRLLYDPEADGPLTLRARVRQFLDWLF